MASINVRKCDGCGAVIPEGHRRFTAHLDLTMVNGTPVHQVVTLDDVCSEACLVTAVMAVVRGLDLEHAQALFVRTVSA